MSCSRRALFLPALLAAAVALAIGGRGLADEGYGSPRQYYSGWEHGSHYSYRNYYYKPTPTYSGYKHHYVIAYPSDQKHLYYYNPYKKTHWGRCDAYGDGHASYSHLPEEYQRSSLADIPESAFPPSGKLPPIPESRDGGRLDLPPDDLPAGFGDRAGSAPPAPAPKTP